MTAAPAWMGLAGDHLLARPQPEGHGMSETTHYEWTVRVHCAMRDVPGPHDLGVQSKGAAKDRYVTCPRHGVIM